MEKVEGEDGISCHIVNRDRETGKSEEWIGTKGVSEAWRN